MWTPSTRIYLLDKFKGLYIYIYVLINFNEAEFHLNINLAKFTLLSIPYSSNQLFFLFPRGGKGRPNGEVPSVMNSSMYGTKYQ